jgi:hypothetical protein
VISGIRRGRRCDRFSEYRKLYNLDKEGSFQRTELKLKCRARIRGGCQSYASKPERKASSGTEEGQQLRRASKAEMEAMISHVSSEDENGEFGEKSLPSRVKSKVEVVIVPLP